MKHREGGGGWGAWLLNNTRVSKLSGIGMWSDATRAWSQTYNEAAQSVANHGHRFRSRGTNASQFVRSACALCWLQEVGRGSAHACDYIAVLSPSLGHWSTAWHQRGLPQKTPNTAENSMCNRTTADNNILLRLVRCQEKMIIILL